MWSADRTRWGELGIPSLGDDPSSPTLRLPTFRRGEALFLTTISPATFHLRSPAFLYNGLAFIAADTAAPARA